jgi:hypothetical protein
MALQPNDLEHNPIVAYVECPLCESVAFFARLSGYRAIQQGGAIVSTDFCDADEKVIPSYTEMVCTTCGKKYTAFPPKVVRNEEWFKKHPTEN